MFKKFNTIFLFSLISNFAFATEPKPIELKTTNGCKYIYFVNDPTQVAKYQDENTVTWDGACVNGYLEGYGNYELRDKGRISIIQRVTYKRGKENGYGTETKFFIDLLNKVEFNGEFSDGHWKKGTLSVYKNNVLSHQFTGNFVNGVIEGQGVITKNDDGSKWTGNFTNGTMNGMGLTTRLNGTTDWVNFENGQIPNVGVGDGSKDHYYCAARGLYPGTSHYAICRNYYSDKTEERKRVQEYIKRTDEIMREALDRASEIDRKYR